MKKYYVPIGIIALGIVAGVVAFLIKPEMFSFIKLGGSGSSVSSPQSDEFVSVFLTNNQVYFGKISNVDSNYPTLKDVYYLRVQTSLVPADTSGNTGVTVEGKNKTTPTPPPQGKQELTLVKLGNELHGPTDEIRLNKDQILYIEQLKKDSKVVVAILQYEAKNK